VASRAGMPPAHPVSWNQPTAPTIQHTIWRKLSPHGWPLQADHVRITEAQLHKWIMPELRVTSRSWKGGFLSYELEKR
jgi:hypothetical protein